MSRHTYTYDHPEHGLLEIAGGWDRPLGYSFLTVRCVATDTMLYTNLDDPKGPDVPPARALEILRQHACPVPTTFISRLERDRVHRTGTYYETHDL
jgi:hypothetical protein